MFLALAQLHCVVETLEIPPDEALAQLPRGVAHVVRFQNALTGEDLSPNEAAALTPRAFGADGAALAVSQEVQVDDQTARVRRGFVLPPAGRYRFRVDDSSRYFGCEEELVPDGLSERRLGVAVVPRVRDVALQVQVHRDGTVAALTDRGLAEVELRPDAPFERAVEVNRGLCSGERPGRGSYWCVRFLGARPEPVDLVARAPGFGLTRVRVSPLASERIVALTARYDGHVTPAATLRLGVGAGLAGADGVAVHGAVDVASASATQGTTCPLGAACVRLVAHAGAAALPYRRDTVLRGPGQTETADGNTAGTLFGLEVGGGVMVVPPGTGDRLRATVLVSGVLASRGEERDAAHGDLLLSPATAVLGGVAELVAGFRLFDGWQLQAGARATFFPSIGSSGRRFSYLGDAPVSEEAASLLHVALTLGLGVEL